MTEPSATDDLESEEHRAALADWESEPDPGPPHGQRRVDILATAVWIAAGALALVGLVLLVIVLLSDEPKDSQYHEAQEDGRLIGPTNGLLDDGSKIGAATFFEEDGTVCTIFGPPGERGDSLYCVPDTAEEVDAINWEVDPEADVDLTVVLVDGEHPRIDFEFEGRTPGHAVGWFPTTKPAVVAVYVGPPWDELDVDPDSAG